MALRSTVRNVIKSWEGIKEPNHGDILKIYNDHKPLARGYTVKKTDAWCATTVSAVAIVCGLDIPLECSCPKMIEGFKKRNQWKDGAYIPKTGDIIFYDWDGDKVSDHVGIVTECDGTTIHVMEGNKNDAVSPRTLAVGNKTIYGYGLPVYEDETLPTTAPAPTATMYVVVPGDTLTAIAKRFGTTVASLKELNGITNANMIKVGQVLKLVAAEPKKTYLTVCTNSAPLRIRKTPNGTTIYSVPKGEKVEYLGETSGTWKKIRYNTVEGWCSNLYLR